MDIESGIEIIIDGKKHTVLFEQLPGLWMLCETGNPQAQPFMRTTKDIQAYMKMATEKKKYTVVAGLVDKSEFEAYVTDYGSTTDYIIRKELKAIILAAWDALTAESNALKKENESLKRLYEIPEGSEIYSCIACGYVGFEIGPEYCGVCEKISDGPDETCYNEHGAYFTCPKCGAFDGFDKAEYEYDLSTKYVDVLTAERDALTARNAKLEKVLEAAEEVYAHCDQPGCTPMNRSNPSHRNLKSAIEAAKEA